MKKGIEAIITSVDEPQLERCLESVHNQSRPFDKIVYYNNIVPESRSHNDALANMEHEYTAWIGGDFILDLDATKKFYHFLKRVDDDPRIFEFLFGLRDTFLQRVICCCAFCRTEVIIKRRYSNTLVNDTIVSRDIRSKGWRAVKLWKQGLSVGTHFDKPDDFQVYRRFYARACKLGARKNEKRYRYYIGELRELKKRTGNKQYDLAVEALHRGYKEVDYPTSHNIEHDRKKYNEFLQEKEKDGTT